MPFTVDRSSYYQFKVLKSGRLYNMFSLLLGPLSIIKFRKFGKLCTLKNTREKLLVSSVYMQIKLVPKYGEFLCPDFQLHLIKI